MSNIAFAFNGLGHAYTADRWIFRNYEATVNKGEVFALMGANGRGKTTLLKIILGILDASEGTVSVNGRVAFVPQLFQVSFDYSVLDMVLMGRARKIGLFTQPTPDDEDAAMKALARFDMAHLAHRAFHELSGGQRQLIIFARAIVGGADILILDEPTSALDLRNQGIVLNWIHTLARREGLTVVFTTYHPHHAYAVADKAMLMFDVDDYASGVCDQVLTESNLQRLYDVPMREIDFVHDGESINTLVPVFRPSFVDSQQ